MDRNPTIIVFYFNFLRELKKYYKEVNFPKKVNTNYFQQNMKKMPLKGHTSSFM